MTHDTSRALLHIHGTDAESFLQGLLTQDVSQAKPNALCFSAMLSPQGKWQHDFFLWRSGEGFFLDHLSAHSELLQKRLKLYKLRAKVSIEPVPAMQLYYHGDGMPDPRHEALPKRLWSTTPHDGLAPESYHQIRLALGIPEGNSDVTENETLLDASYDYLHAVSFTKGCYVGQEITARMHYKQVVRKGFYTVYSDAPLTPYTPILSGEQVVAELRSAEGKHGIAFARFDTVEAARAHGYTVNGHPVTLSIPTWEEKKFATFVAHASAHAGGA